MQLDDVNMLMSPDFPDKYIVWKKFKVGSSFFWPCLTQCKEQKEEILRKAKRARVKVKIKLQTEDGVQGLRVWRVD
jgi:hypothetical protein